MPVKANAVLAMPIFTLSTVTGESICFFSTGYFRFFSIQPLMPQQFTPFYSNKMWKSQPFFLISKLINK